MFVARVAGMIDLGLGPFIERVLHSATETGAALVLVEVETFGGRVDAAVLIRDHLLRAKVPTAAFVNKRAISAGALIALAAEKIVMASGATIGAATPVEMGQPDQPAKPVAEKTVSYVRKEFRATADARKRPGLLAEAMVDTDIEVAGVIDKGKLLTLTTAEALRHGMADFQADTLAEVLEKLGLGDAEIQRQTENWAERIVRFLTHPVVSSLLMSLAILGILIEVRTPGFGIPGLVGLASLAAFFWGHFLVRLVGWEDILLVVVGLLLLALEVFVLPGFGIAGVLGVLALVSGLALSLIGAGASAAYLVYAALRVLIALAVAIVAALLLIRLLPRLPGSRSLVLMASLPASDGSKPGSTQPAIGDLGTTFTPLRPSGIAELRGRRVDVVSSGDFIDAGCAVRVIQVAGSRVVVEVQRPETEPSKGTSP